MFETRGGGRQTDVAGRAGYQTFLSALLMLFALVLALPSAVVLTSSDVVAQEQEQQRQKQPDGPDEGGPVPYRARVHAPGGGQEVAMKAGDDDDETLEPHADVDEHRDQEEQGRRSAHLLSQR